SSFTAKLIEEEIKQLIDKNYQRAETLLKDNADKLRVMAEALMKYETIDSKQIDDIMNGDSPRDPEGWDDSDRTEPPKAKKAKSETAKESKIGGPAEQP
ncbi:MAG: ATP-dependent metalloprotease, partial [Kangiellaceae bacterium]|nr:ATP-dependent metalloprotease [Kangiellaceae bacterium]